MSKSLGNTIHLSDSADEVKKKVMKMYTDPKRVRADVPGTVEGNPVFVYHDAFNPNKEEVEDLKTRYRLGKVGDVEVKTKLANALNAHLDPIRERRAAVLAKPNQLKDILFEGSKRARAVAIETMERVRSAVKIRLLKSIEAEITASAIERRKTRSSKIGCRAVFSCRGFLRVLRVRACLMTESHDFESSVDAMPVHLDNFEGPLDLLIHLIRKNELNIYDIPISLITRQYLDAIQLMQELNLDVAGEFLVMAATLIHIKSKMLLPRPETAAGVDGEGEDPRDALVRRLLEHQKFKAAAELLHEREQLRAAQWQRPDERVAEIAGDEYEPELEVDLYSLLTAFQAVVQRAKHRPKVLLPPEQVPVEVRIEQLLARLSEHEACGFEELFSDVDDRAGLIVTFLALLEMIRLKLVRVFQAGSFGPIRVYKRARPSDAPHPIGDPEERT